MIGHIRRGVLCKRIYIWLSNACCNFSTIKSASASVKINGGAIISTLESPGMVLPLRPILTPDSKQVETIAPTFSPARGSLVSLFATNSIPSSKPLPRISPTPGMIC